MSRSFKRHMISGNTACASEKDWKQAMNRILRRRNRIRLSQEQELTDRKETYDVWDGPKDGKSYFGNSEFLDENGVKKMMRK